tara:strand:- start:334 stop:579 length:246 start_codon:yes stop_codon:yes gene_type:complete
MEKNVRYGNNIWEDNRMARYTTIKFDDLESLKNHWVENKHSKSWKYDISNLTGEKTDWVNAVKFFETRFENVDTATLDEEE